MRWLTLRYLGLESYTKRLSIVRFSWQQLILYIIAINHSQTQSTAVWYWTNRSGDRLDGEAGDLAKHSHQDEYAVIRQLYSSTRGINLLIRNLLANPHVRFLVVLNATKEDNNAGAAQCLLDFFNIQKLARLEITPILPGALSLTCKLTKFL